jgi:hypothetical protein
MSSSGVPLELSRETNVWRISRGTQSVPRPAALVIFPNFPADVVMVQGCANSGGEDEVVILPERSGAQLFIRLALELFAKCLHRQLWQQEHTPASPRLCVARGPHGTVIQRRCRRRGQPQPT